MTYITRDLESKILSLSQEYAAILTRCIRILPPHVVVHRITGDGAKRDLVAPLWSGDKKRVMNYLKGYLARELAQQED